MKTLAKEKGLGAGVGLLFGGDEEEVEKYFFCDITRIVPNKHQPRTVFKDEDLVELSDSIKENGIIQPLIVKTTDDEDVFELIAGERRLRASKLIGLETVPVVIHDVKDENTLLELALIENVQRTDLNAIEEAEAYSKLIEKFGYTQEQTAKRVGKKRSTITNLLRLLNLPDFIQDDIKNDILKEGHARTLLRLGDDKSLVKIIRDQILSNNLSVRQTEALVKKTLASPQTKVEKSENKKGIDGEIPSSYCNTLVNQLTNKLQSKVKIVQNGSRGKLEIEYYSVDDLERLMDLLVDD